VWFPRSLTLVIDKSAAGAIHFLSVTEGRGLS